MSAASLRAWLRWSHIAVGVFLAVYVCSPLHQDALATLIARVSLIPLVALTGVVMWQQGRLTRLFRPGRRG
jgi:hypothetical protein